MKILKYFVKIYQNVSMQIFPLSWIKSTATMRVAIAMKIKWREREKFYFSVGLDITVMSNEITIYNSVKLTKPN